MAKQVDSTNIGTLLEALIAKVKSVFWRKEETDSAPTSGSDNLVKSGGVYSSLQGIRQFKVINLGNFNPSNGTHTLGTKSEAAAALNITEAQLDSLLNCEYDYIEFGIYGGFKTQVMAPLLSGYMCMNMNAHYVMMPFIFGFFRGFDEDADVYSYSFDSIGIKDVTVGGESVATDATGGVAVIPAIPDVSQFITKSVNDLVNYYLKSEVYTKDEVASLIGAIQQFHYEIAASTSAVTSPSNNVLYLIGPTGSGSDKYEEYVYSGGWVKIGDTSIDLSGYVTTQALNTALSAYTTTNDLTTLLAGKQDTIDAQNKLDYSLIANTPTIPTVPTDIVKYTAQTLTDAQKSQARTNIGAGTYSKPANGIPASDLANGVIPTVPTEVFVVTYGTTTQSEILAAVAAGKLPICKYGDNLYVYAGESSADYSQFTSVLYDTAYRIYVKNSTWGGGSYEIYSKPSGGIPASDLADDVIPDVSSFITKSVNDLVNYYLKSEVYTKDEVASLIGAIQQFHYEIAASTSAVTSPSNNVLYLIGPTGSGSDKYEEYVYSGGWVKIGDTSIDLSGYVTTQALNTALTGYVTSGALETALAGKQDKIDANHKLDYSLLENTPTIPTQYAGSPTAGGFANKAVAIPFGNVDADSTATEITATVDNFPTTLTDGVCAYIRNNAVASASGFTLNINGTGAKPVYQTLADASRSTTVFNANSTYLFVYNSTRVEGGCWDLYYGYNSNDNTVGYNLRTNGASAPPAAQKYYRYRLLFTAANGLSLVPANTSSSTSATSAKTVNQAKIDPFGVIFYYSYTSAVNAAASPNASYLWMQYNAVALGYSFNRTGEALEMTARDPVYLKCAPQSDGSAIIDADNPIVQALPTTADGKIYIFLGFAESATAITLYYWHPVYYHDGTRVTNWPGVSVEDIKSSIGDIQTALDTIIGKEIIEFSVKLGTTTTTCQAEEGMTWREWRNSDYNTLGLWIYSDSMHQDPVIVKKDGSSPSFIENSSYTLVKASDIIIEGEQYDDEAFAWEGSNPVWE